MIFCTKRTQIVLFRVRKVLKLIQHNLIDPDSPRDIGYFIHGTEKLHWKQVRSFLSKRYDILEEVTKLQSFKVTSPTVKVSHLPSPDPFISKNISRFSKSRDRCPVGSPRIPDKISHISYDSYVLP